MKDLHNAAQPIVIIGGGFGGLNAAVRLGRAGVPTLLIDRNNYHLFQPLLYQVATGFLAPGDIAAPLRSIVARYPSVTVLREEVRAIDVVAKVVKTDQHEYSYRKLIVATGATHSYFSRDEWSENAPGLKTVEDATEIRRRVLLALEEAESTQDLETRRRLLTFAIIGAGPTGVELAGALAELARGTLKGEFRRFDPRDISILLIEGGDRVLPSFSESSSAYASRSLTKIGVQVLTRTRVTNVAEHSIEILQEGERKELQVGAVIWAAGVKASGLGALLAQVTGALKDDLGRVVVTPTLTLPGFADIYVIGDLAHAKNESGEVLPGVAPVAIQQGAYVASAIIANLRGKPAPSPFRYHDRGNMAVIGRGRALAESRALTLTGFPAWLTWAVVHIYFLIEFENKVVVFFHWAWNYLTNTRGSRLITGSASRTD